jgi:hypothetical protein
LTLSLDVDLLLKKQSGWENDTGKSQLSASSKILKDQ